MEELKRIDDRLDSLFHDWVSLRTKETLGCMCVSETYETMQRIEELVKERANLCFLLTIGKEK